MFDRVLVQRFEPELRTKGGIMLPEKSKGKVLEATVVAVGGGARNEVSSFSWQIMELKSVSSNAT